jgi:ribosomal 50S subunit-recycling heat shock protein
MEPEMRVDLFLKLMGITKTRMAAKRICEQGGVLLGTHPLKPSHGLKGGEEVKIFLPRKETLLKVVALPPGKGVAKADRMKFVEILSVTELM